MIFLCLKFVTSIYCQGDLIHSGIPAHLELNQLELLYHSTIFCFSKFQFFSNDILFTFKCFCVFRKQGQAGSCSQSDDSCSRTSYFTIFDFPDRVSYCEKNGRLSLDSLGKCDSGEIVINDSLVSASISLDSSNWRK